MKDMKIDKFNERIDWRGQWIPDDNTAYDKSPFERAREYSLKQDLVRELLLVTKKYQGKIKDKTITEALIDIIRKYDNEIEIKNKK
jgi:hypothetical protein